MALPARSGDTPGWNSKRENIWNDAKQESVARSVRVWDQKPSAKREWVWEWARGDAGFDAGGSVEGEGTLTWRTQGSAEYDPKNFIEVYTGSFSAGKRVGEGKVNSLDGREYFGAWKDDLPHGKGRLRYPNGDIYLGDFSKGMPEGTGALHKASGESWKGEFSAGKPNGKGIATTVDGKTYNSNWVDGVESPESKLEREKIEGGNADGKPALDIALIADPSKNTVFEFRNPGAVAYVSSSESGEVEIEPTGNAWDTWGKNGGLLDETYWGTTAPVFLDAALALSSVDPITFKRGEIEVETSHLDLRPYLHFSPDNLIEDYDFTFALVNSGWGKVLNPKLEFTLEPLSEPGGADAVKKISFKKTLNEFDLGVTVNLMEEFTKGRSRCQVHLRQSA